MENADWKMSLEVDFIGRPASERRMRPMLVVPGGKPEQLLPECLGTE
jgi:hypothetical protein